MAMRGDARHLAAYGSMEYAPQRSTVRLASSITRYPLPTPAAVLRAAAQAIHLHLRSSRASTALKALNIRRPDSRVAPHSLLNALRDAALSRLLDPELQQRRLFQSLIRHEEPPDQIYQRFMPWSSSATSVAPLACLAVVYYQEGGERSGAHDHQQALML